MIPPMFMGLYTLVKSSVEYFFSMSGAQRVLVEKRAH